MNISRCKRIRSSIFRLRFLTTPVVAVFLAAPAFGQAGASPWENAVSVLQQAFTSTIARGLSLVAIVVAGLTLSFREGGSLPSRFAFALVNKYTPPFPAFG